MPNDEKLLERVRDALLKDDRLSEQPIQVTVQDGMVHLAGKVQSHNRKLSAQLIAASFDDCRGVLNDLVVTPPGSVSDEKIGEYVRAALDAHADITSETISVAVSNGVVTMNGTAASYWERTLADDVALGSKGVCAVKNLLIVSLDEQIEDEALCREIQAALSHTRGLSAVDLRVAVNDDIAVLSGTVPNLWQREQAEIVVRRFRVTQVHNEIAVTGP